MRVSKQVINYRLRLPFVSLLVHLLARHEQLVAILEQIARDLESCNPAELGGRRLLGFCIDLCGA